MSFHIMELQQRLARNMRTCDPSSMASDEALALLDAINAGLYKMYINLPPIYKRTKASYTLRAPVIETVGVTKYSTAVTVATFADEDRGKTIVIPEDQGDNEIVGTAQLANEYLGSTGSKEATIYSDSVPIDVGFSSVVKHPRLIVGSAKRQLARVEAEQFRSLGASSSKCIGAPDSYYVAPVGLVMNGDPMVLLKVYPMPDADYRLEMEIEVMPKRFSFTSLNGSSVIPIQDSIAESILIPLCEWELSSSRFYTGDRLGAQDKKNEALAYCARVMHELLPTSNAMGTPVGF